MNQNYAVARSEESILATNKLIKNTYILLSMTLLFSAAMAVVSLYSGVSHMVGFISSISGFLLLWLVLPRFANSSTGVGIVFLVTGLLGFGLGPMLSSYLSLPNGPQTVVTAMGGTGVIFLGLSGYALTTRKDFSFMAGYLAIGFLVALIAFIGAFIFNVPALSLAVSAVFILLMSGYILYDTSQMIHNPGQNYLYTTIQLYLDIVILFQHLLHLLGALGDD